MILNSDQQDSDQEISLPIGLIGASFLLVVVKGVILGRAIGQSPFLLHAVRIAIGDITFVALIVLVAILSGLIRARWIRYVAIVVITFGLILYWVDLVIILNLNDRLTIANAVEVSSGFKLYIPYYVTWESLLGLILFCGACFPRIRLSRRTGALGAILSVIFVCITNTLILDLFDTPYSVNLRSIDAALQLGTRQSDLTEDAESLRTAIPESFGEFQIPSSHPNIVLYVVESMSAIDFGPISGGKNLFPRTTEVAKNGVTFHRCFANSDNSESGIAALLTGLEPIPLPQHNGYVQSTYQIFPSFPRYLKERGYHTAMIGTPSLEFKRDGEFFHEIGFDEVFGHENMPRFNRYRGARKTFAPDEELIAAAEEWISTNTKSSFFLMLANTSSHPPYRNSAGTKISEEEAFLYTDLHISRLAELLELRGFFSNGLLIVVGDHRKHTLVPVSEWERFGPDAVARVPLIIVGSGAPQGRSDMRMLSQADVFRRLYDLISNEQQITDTAIFSSRHNWSRDIREKEIDLLVIRDKEGTAETVSKEKVNLFEPVFDVSVYGLARMQRLQAQIAIPSRMEKPFLSQAQCSKTRDEPRQPLPQSGVGIQSYDMDSNGGNIRNVSRVPVLQSPVFLRSPKSKIGNYINVAELATFVRNRSEISLGFEFFGKLCVYQKGYLVAESAYLPTLQRLAVTLPSSEELTPLDIVDFVDMLYFRGVRKKDPDIRLGTIPKDGSALEEIPEGVLFAPQSFPEGATLLR